MVYLVNILMALFFTAFSLRVFPALAMSPYMMMALFSCHYALLWLFSFFYNRQHFKKVPLVIALFFYYLKELIRSSFKVAYDVLTPTHHMQPGVVAFHMEAKTDLEITLLANFITLTPGSLSIDISEDRTILYIHETYIWDGDIEKYKKKLRNGFEKRILNITR